MGQPIDGYDHQSADQRADEAVSSALQAALPHISHAEHRADAGEAGVDLKAGIIVDQSVDDGHQRGGDHRLDGAHTNTGKLDQGSSALLLHASTLTL